jgi:hypothetical protein
MWWLDSSSQYEGRYQEWRKDDAFAFIPGFLASLAGITLLEYDLAVRRRAAKADGGQFGWQRMIVVRIVSVFVAFVTIQLAFMAWGLYRHIPPQTNSEFLSEQLREKYKATKPLK